MQIEDDPNGDLSFDYSLLIETPDIVAVPLKSRKYPGLYAFVDAADVEFVGDRWFPNAGGDTFYAIRDAQQKDGSRVVEKLHRRLLSPGDSYVDHVDGNGLNNTRPNLRRANHTQNKQNSKSYRGSSSRFTGVYYEKDRDVWRAQINVNGRRVRLGSFKSEVEAARVRDGAALQHYGEFVRLNFPPTTSYVVGNERLAFRVTITNYWPWTPLDTPCVGIPVRRHVEG